MKEIFLSDGHIALCDDIDFLYLLNFKWHLRKSCKTKYAKRNIKYSFICMHEEIIKRMGLVISKGYQIDHRDRNGLNNQRFNLRIITCSLSSFNRNIHSNNTSGFTGIRFREDHMKWESYININKKYKHLGLFNILEDAIKVRREAELKYYGEYK